MRKFFVLIGLILSISIISGCGGGSSNTTADTPAVDTPEADTPTVDTPVADSPVVDTVIETTPSIIGVWRGSCIPIEQAGTSLIKILSVTNSEDIVEKTQRYSSSLSCTGSSTEELENRVYVIGGKQRDSLYTFQLTGTTAHQIDITSSKLEIYFHGTLEPDIYYLVL